MLAPIERDRAGSNASSHLPSTVRMCLVCKNSLGPDSITVGLQISKVDEPANRSGENPRVHGPAL